MSDDKCPDGRDCVYSKQSGQNDHFEQAGRAMCATCPVRIKPEDSPHRKDPTKWVPVDTPEQNWYVQLARAWKDTNQPTLLGPSLSFR